MEESPLEFGIFDQIESDGRPPGEIYEEHLRLVEQADRAGFHGYHLSEHHGTPLSLSPSPSLILASAAQRTEHIRLGVLVYGLPYHDPYRLANEIGMLDHLSGGRLELGVGRGVSPIEAKYFGIQEVEDARAIYRETLDILRAAFTSDVLNFEGKYHSYSDVPLWVRPVQSPYPPLWFPSSNEQSIPFTAQHGLNTVLNNYFSRERTQGLVSMYKELWEEHQNDPDRMNAHVATPKIGWAVKVVMAPTDAEAERIARPAFETWLKHINWLYKRAGIDRTIERGDYGEQRENGSLLVGSPQTVAQEAGETVAATGINYLLCSFAFGALPYEPASTSMTLFAEHVMPSLRAGGVDSSVAR